MLTNYLKIAYRNLLKNKVFSLINILGLAMGMAVCLLILRYVQFESSYDDFHAHADQIYRVAYHSQVEDNLYESALNYLGLGPTMQENFQEVKNFTRLYLFGSYQFACALQYQDIIYNESEVYFADANFLNFFSFSLLTGNAKVALQQPNSAVISEETARKYFGQSDPIGKILTLKSSMLQKDFLVTGVMKDVPAKSHFSMKVLLSMSSLPAAYRADLWDTNAVYTYLQIPKQADTEKIAAQIPALLHQHLKNKEVEVTMKLQPLQDIYLYSRLEDEMKAGGNPQMLRFLTFLAFTILLIALINYINLTTSRALERAREVGVRKVSGANRSQLIVQFLTESALVNIISILVAITLFQVTQQFFYQFIGMPLSGGMSEVRPILKYWFPIFVFLAAGIFLTGFQPAWLLSSFRSVQVLKGNWAKTANGILLRKSLVIFQFCISIALLAGVLALHQQNNFMQQHALGIDISKTLVIKTPSNTDSTYLGRLTDFKENMQKYIWVAGMSTSAEVPGNPINWTFEVKRNKSHAAKNLQVQVISTDFIKTYGLQVLAGRNFFLSEQPDARFGNKTESVMLNQEAVKMLGFESPENAVGSIICANDHVCKVVGVINNFHQSSLKDPLQPFIFLVNNRDSVYYSIKLTDTQNAAQQLAAIRTAWNIYFPDNPFDYFYLEDYFQRQYQTDQHLGKVFTGFSLLAILIACLGLFGLSSYTVTQRTKEIGIRKVLGASVQSILTLLSWDFIRLVLIASLLALPVTYYAIHLWLENYAFSIEIGWWMLLVPVLLIVGIALATISFQTIRAALTNPVKSLRYE